MATQWGRIRAAYLKGDVTYKQLAEKYGLSVKTIQNRASKEGWTKEKGRIREEVGEKIHSRIVRARTEQLEKLIEANDLIIDGLLEMARLVKAKPNVVLFDDKQTLRNAESMTKAIQTATQTQRDLLKLPTLDQDMAKKAEAQRKREAKAKLEIEREKWEAEKAEKAKTAEASDGTLIRVELPEGEEAVDE